MSRDLRLALVATLEDRASAASKRMQQTLSRESDRSARATERRSERAAQLQERNLQRTRTINERMYTDRERLGIRSEQRIRREMQLTEAAYQRLARTGRLSSSEQARAYDAMQQRVGSLRREMAALDTQQSRAARAAGMGSRALQGWQMAAGAVTGATFALAPPVKRTMNYDRRLAEMANVAYADRDKEGREQGMATLDAAIRRAVQVGGGSRDQAAETLDNLIASGAMSQSSAENLLPVLQKAAVATSADPGALAQIAIRSMQTFGISESDIPMALDMAVKAGQEGGFEIKDMARWLPQQMAAASSAGMKGLNDFGVLLAANQAAMITAGSTDEAGNNMVNWLAKLTSRESAMAAARIEISPGKSIDLVGTLAAEREKGVNQLDAFVGLVDKVVGKNPEYQKLQQRLSATSDSSERRTILESQTALLQGSAVGELIADRQAAMGLVGYMNNRQYVAKITDALPMSAGTIDANHALIASTASYQAESAGNDWRNAETDSFRQLSQHIGDLSGKVSELATEYPGLMQALVVSTNALNALALAAGAAGAVMLLRRGGAGSAAAGRGVAAGTAGAAAVARESAARAALSRIHMPTFMTRAGGIAAGAAGAYGLYDIATDGSLPMTDKGAGATQLLGGLGGAWGGAIAGAKAGALLGPWGALGGSLLGGFAGNYLGDELGEVLGKEIFSKTGAGGDGGLMTIGGINPEELANAVAARQKPLKDRLEVEVTVRGGEIVALINEENARQARRN